MSMVMAVALALAMTALAQNALAEPTPSQTAPAHAPAQATATAQTLSMHVEKRLPHDAQAFTQGLIFHQGELVESTGLYGQSSLRRTNPETGGILALTRLDKRFFGEGLALCPERPGKPPRLVQLTWREGRILTYDAVGLRQLGSHRLRGEGWGLAWDGARLILSDGTDTLRLLQPDDFAQTGQLNVRDGSKPVRELNELEWVGGWLLANVLGQDRIAVIRPPGTSKPGQVAAWLDISALRQELGPQAEAANGVAFDPQARKLFVTGKRWDTVFVLALPPLLEQPPR
ncbi:MAG: hypothetical protein A2051_03530 [Desulfovibrionales bacterium GWA2_65_9]|nr:MAG: hypothetical protein A2051_03530 [Desulfovibrionales bacterium GWA2_65_9]